MPYGGVPFVGSLYDYAHGPGANISQLLLERGRAQAASADRIGQIWSNTVNNLGQIPRQYEQDKLLQEGRAAQAEERQATADLRRQQADQFAKKEATEQAKAQAIHGLWSGPQPPTPDAIFQVYGAQDGKAVIDGMKALQPGASKNYKDRMEQLRDGARAIQAQPPELRQQAYTLFRGGWLKEGIISQEEAPEQYDERLVKPIADYGKEPAKDSDKKYKVTVPGPGGVPIAKLATEKDLEAGVQEYREPKAPKAETQHNFQPKDVMHDGHLVRANYDSSTGKYFDADGKELKNVGSPLGATERRYVTLAKTVNETGEKIIGKLRNPEYAKEFGIAAGRYNNLNEMIGNPPPKFAEVLGLVKSFAQGNMSIHGFRSNEGAEKVNEFLSGKNTPDVLISKIMGLNSFSNDYLENSGVPMDDKPAAGGGAPQVGQIEDGYKFKGGNPADPNSWEKQ